MLRSEIPILLIRSIHRVGQILALVVLYKFHDIKRFLRVQDFYSYARLIRPAKKSDGKWA
jgi:transposase